MPKDLTSLPVERKTNRGNRLPARRSRGDVELVLRPTGAPNDELLKSVIDEWLVPRLIDEFLREQRGREADTSQEQSAEAEHLQIGNSR